MEKINSIRLSPLKSSSRHNSPRATSSVNLQFNPLGQIPSPRQSPRRQSPRRQSSQRQSPRRAPFRMSLNPSPRQSPPRAPFRMSLNPSPRPVRTPIQAWVELPKAESPLLKEPDKLFFVQPKTAQMKPKQAIKPKTILGFFRREKIVPTVSPTVPTGTVATVGIVHNKKIELPSKLLAIYYVDLIYDTIRLLAIKIVEIVVNIGKELHIIPPIFNVDTVRKLEKLIEDINNSRYIYTTSLSTKTKTKDIKVLYLFVKYLIKKPRKEKNFLAHMIEIKRAKKDSEDDINNYSNYISWLSTQDLQREINHQNFGLSSEIIKLFSKINHHDVENKLQSLKDTMVVFIDIINNILNDDVETRVSSFSGGYVFFANYRYNKDEEEYTPLIYNYIEAYSINFQNIYSYFENIFTYFKKINKRMGDRYVNENKNVALEYKKHSEYKKTSLRATLATNNAVSAVKTQLYNITNNVATKDFEKRLKEMKNTIDVTNYEINYLYQKI